MGPEIPSRDPNVADVSKNADATVEERPFQGRVCAHTSMPFRARGRFSFTAHEPRPGPKPPIIEDALRGA